MSATHLLLHPTPELLVVHSEADPEHVVHNRRH